MLTTYLSTLLQNLAWGKPKGGDIALLQITIAKLKKKPKHYNIFEKLLTWHVFRNQIFDRVKKLPCVTDKYNNGFLQKLKNPPKRDFYFRHYNRILQDKII